jgi:DNA-binding transcriptional LysR family regulator
VVSYNLIVDLVKSGFGIGYATKEFITNELEHNLLYEIEVEPSMPERTIVLATMDKKEPNYSVKKLIEMLKKK